MEFFNERQVTLGMVLLANELKFPSPLATYKTNTVPPLAMTFKAIPAIIMSVFSLCEIAHK